MKFWHVDNGQTLRRMIQHHGIIFLDGTQKLGNDGILLKKQWSQNWENALQGLKMTPDGAQKWPGSMSLTPFGGKKPPRGSNRGPKIVENEVENEIEQKNKQIYN